MFIDRFMWPSVGRTVERLAPVVASCTLGPDPASDATFRC
jgi:hypothetical protein